MVSVQYRDVDCLPPDMTIRLKSSKNKLKMHTAMAGPDGVGGVDVFRGERAVDKWVEGVCRSMFPGCSRGPA